MNRRPARCPKVGVRLSNVAQDFSLALLDLVKLPVIRQPNFVSIAGNPVVERVFDFLR